MVTISKRAYVMMLLVAAIFTLTSLSSILTKAGILKSGLSVRPAQPGLIVCQFQVGGEELSVVLQGYKRYPVCSTEKLPVVCQQAAADSFHPKGSQSKAVEKHIDDHGSQLVIVIREYY